MVVLARFGTPPLFHCNHSITTHRCRTSTIYYSSINMFYDPPLFDCEAVSTSGSIIKWLSTKKTTVLQVTFILLPPVPYDKAKGTNLMDF